MLSKLKAAVAGAMVGFSQGYDAVETKGRRKAPSSVIRSEDNHLPARERATLMANTRDLRRNASTARWAIQKHLDFVSTFRFQARGTDPEVNQQLEKLMRAWDSPKLCDVAERHSLRKIIRLVEAARVVDGDCLVIKTAAGRLQVIEADRVANASDGLPKGTVIEDWVQGVQIDKNQAGRAKAYMVCDRGNNSAARTYNTTVRAENAYHLGFFDRYDQVRGVSPMACAVDMFRDGYEGMDYALAKLKVAQMFGMVTYRDAAESSGLVTGDEETKKYNVDMGRGPFMLDLDPGDRAEFLESGTPASETQEYLKLTIQIAIKCLDIPYSFFDESHTNFYGSRGALIQYQKSCHDKRRDLIDMLDHLTAWRVNLWIMDGVLKLPAGMTVSDLKWDWVPAGIPWWDPSKEATGAAKAISAGLDNFQRVCRESGTDFYANIDANAEAIAYAKAKGVPLNLDGVATTQLPDATVKPDAIENDDISGEEE